MKLKDVNDVAIAMALLVSIVSLVVVVVTAGAGSLPATGLRDLVLLLGGALAGSKVPH